MRGPGSTSRALGCCLLLCAAGCAGPPPQPKRVLLFSKTAGYRHDSIPAGLSALAALARAEGLEVDATEDAAAFDEATLPRYAAVVFLSTTGDLLDAGQQAVLERYVRAGGGWLGVHAAADSGYGWPFYGELVGAYFKDHPAIQPATLVVEDAAHPAAAGLPSRWTRTDEWYNFRTNPRAVAHVVLALDESTYGGGGMGADHPIAWCRGRSFYTGLGHTAESYTEPLLLAHLRGGLLVAAGLARCGTP